MKKIVTSGQEGKPMDYSTALQRAAGLCSRQEQSTGHIRGKLTEWNVAGRDMEKIIRLLKDEKYLDDRRYAAVYARDKFRFNRWGRIKIAQMLRQNCIGDEDISHALNQLDDEAYFNACLELLRMKAKGLKEKNTFTRKGKLYRFAAGKGYEPELIHRVLGRMEKD
jgi:regulatory protein